MQDDEEYWLEGLEFQKKYRWDIKSEEEQNLIYSIVKEIQANKLSNESIWEYLKTVPSELAEDILVRLNDNELVEYFHNNYKKGFVILVNPMDEKSSWARLQNLTSVKNYKKRLGTNKEKRLITRGEVCLDLMAFDYDKPSYTEKYEGDNIYIKYLLRLYNELGNVKIQNQYFYFIKEYSIIILNNVLNDIKSCRADS